ncbi:XRE family transcriptional regulator [uncultured Oscillibacter sp.]|uniref:LexA family protein n=1 Tax=uncultured Oscillibacter sp. TaxID=876091 RepID=UPI002803C901|nr:XRE family transcriptional regulator [uncultured Oscillibacter sp.]
MRRLKELRSQRGLRQIDFAKDMGILQSTLSSWENGRYEPDSEMLIKIANYFGVTVDYLLGGEKVSSSTKTKGKWIPVLGDVAAGIPIEAIEDIVDYEEIDAALAATGDFFGLRIKGSSMEPRIREGDVVIVRKQDDVDTGDTAVVMVNGDSATVKRIKKEPDGSLVLIPNNPAYDAQHFSPAEILNKPVHIIGKVVELRGKF